VTFDIAGGTLQDLLQEAIDAFTAQTDRWLTSWNINETVHSLIINGIFAGVGTVLSFIPIIVLLFFFLSILEDTGYMARIAFVMDKLLRKIGLSGRSIVPLLVGFGCSVPSVMASRTLPSEHDRKLTVMLTPFMSCTAKLPIYAFFAAAFFPKTAAWVMVSLYVIGIVVGIVVALIMKKTFYRGEAVPFVMELPNYRLPGLKSVGRLLWDKTKDFMQRAFSVIFIATIVIWFLQSFDFRLNLVDDSSRSMLAAVASFISPVFQPLGFGDWRIVTALISGFLAKESVVSTLTVLFGSGVAIHSILTTVTAYSLLVFCLLYTPCVATIATVRREMGGRYALGLVVWQCSIAWICAFIVSLF
jgi:ferrous iron transport protein B